MGTACHVTNASTFGHCGHFLILEKLIICEPSIHVNWFVFFLFKQNIPLDKKLHSHVTEKRISQWSRTHFSRGFSQLPIISPPFFLSNSQALALMDCGDSLDPFPRYKSFFFSAPLAALQEIFSLLSGCASAPPSSCQLDAGEKQRENYIFLSGDQSTRHRGWGLES